MGWLKEGAEVLIGALDRLVPKKSAIAIRSFPDFDDSTKAILNEALRRKCTVTILVEPGVLRSAPPWALHKGVQIRSAYALSGIWAFLRSRVLYFTHGVYGGRTPPSARVSVNLWHGMPLKRIGKAENSSARVPKATFLIATSAHFSAALANAFGVAEADVRLTGLPRNDLLLSAPQLPKSLQQLIAQRRVIVFLPTYRRSRQGQIRSDGAATVYDEILGALAAGPNAERLREQGVLLFIKPHPLEATTHEFRKISDAAYQISDAWLREQNLTLYELLARSSALVTDYSSVYVDYLLTRNPIYFYMPDVQSYEQNRGFNSEFELGSLPGALCASIDQLVDTITNPQDEFEGARRRCLLKMHKHVDPCSSLRVLDIACKVK